MKYKVVGYFPVLPDDLPDLLVDYDLSYVGDTGNEIKLKPDDKSKFKGLMYIKREFN